jgi:hypothetical protein
MSVSSSRRQVERSLRARVEALTAVPGTPHNFGRVAVLVAAAAALWLADVELEPGSPEPLTPRSLLRKIRTGRETGGAVKAGGVP